MRGRETKGHSVFHDLQQHDYKHGLEHHEKLYGNPDINFTDMFGPEIKRPGFVATDNRIIAKKTVSPVLANPRKKDFPFAILKEMYLIKKMSLYKMRESLSVDQKTLKRILKEHGFQLGGIDKRTKVQRGIINVKLNN